MRLATTTLVWMVAAGAELCGSPVLAQSTDLVLTLDGPADPSPPGGSADYDVTVANLGPGHATDVEINGTIPAGSTLAGADGCSLDSDPLGKIRFPCTVDGTLIDGDTVTVTLTLAYDLPEAPASCPTSLPDLDIDVTAATTDPNPLDNVASVAVPLAPYADVEAGLSGPGRAKVGDVLEFEVSVVNHGPCVATAVGVDAGGIRNAGLVSRGLLYRSATGACAAMADDDATCPLGDLASGAAVTYQKSYEVADLPDDVMSTGNPNGVLATSADVADPNEDNNLAVTQTIVKQHVGCESTPGLEPWAAFAAFGLWLRRRSRLGSRASAHGS